MGLAWAKGFEKTVAIIFNPLDHKNFNAILSEQQAHKISSNDAAKFFITEMARLLGGNLSFAQEKLDIVGNEIFSAVTTHQENQIICEGKNKKYLFENNTLWYVTDLPTYYLLGFQNLVHIRYSKKSHQHLSKKPMESLAKCIILKTNSSGHHWILRNGKRHHIPNPATRLFLKEYNPRASKDNMVLVEDDYLQTIPIGNPLVSFHEFEHKLNKRPRIERTNNSTAKTTKPLSSLSKPLFVEGLSKAEVYTKTEVENGVFFNYDKGRKFQIHIRFDQVEIAYSAIDELNQGQNLEVIFDVGLKEQDGGTSELKETCKVLVGQYDFDADDIDELVIAIQDNDSGDNGICLNVFKLRGNSWERIGLMSGALILEEPKAYIKMNKVTIPRHLRGLYYEWRFEMGEFRYTGSF